MMNQQIRVALVNDEPVFLEGLSLLLAKCSFIKIVIKANGSNMLLEELENHSQENFPQVILFEAQTNLLDGFELLVSLKKKYDNLHIIVLSSQYQPTTYGNMISMGASAFLPKNTTLNILTEAIETVNRRGIYFRPQDQEMIGLYMQEKQNKRSINANQVLSEREQEVLRLICEELTNGEIALKLCLSKRTVESHRQRIIEKIGVKNTAGLVIYAICRSIFIPKVYNYQ